ncbi:hypothetical protein BT69DRAFT_1277933 [Atractiella rhizophila]|nr:hypothetical protein BT69DRAFT_1277933 [Atractiella rhizophila]
MMKSIFALSFLALSAVNAAPLKLSQKRQTNGVDASRVPEFGVTPGVKDPAGSASCVGVDNKLIPCTCPPNRDNFIQQMIANVGAGHAINNPAVSVPAFPSGNSLQDIETIFTISTVTLQNLNGPGVGCPQVATTWASQLAAIQANGGATSPAPAPAAPAPAAPAPAASNGNTNGVDASRVPEFGVTPGVPDPAGSASCVGVNGKLIPCTCPPNRDDFIQQMIANVGAGHAVNNPAVSVPAFPSGNSLQDIETIFTISTVTLQNLKGPGVGCPQVATTWASQLAAIQANGGATSPAPAQQAAAPAPATPAPAPAAGNTNGVDASRVPEFGVTPGVPDPAGSASCVGVNGKLIPCTCPPNRDEFIQQMIANVGVGHAVNNPAVSVPAFPSGNSLQDIETIFTISTITLQNLKGPGVGCPQVATTWASQLDAIRARGGA